MAGSWGTEMGRSVLITGAAGNIGTKLTAHLREQGHELRLLDRRGGGEIVAADFGVFDEDWAAAFRGVDTVLHFAGNPNVGASWESALRDNVGGTLNVLRAARLGGVRRVVFASTNHVVGGHRFGSGPVTTDMVPAPLTPYGISKLMGEELGRGFHDETGADFLALRIGYFQPGENRPGPHMVMGEWGQLMWLSNGDMNRAIDGALAAPSFGFAVVNLVSCNEGMRWDIEHTKRVIGYEPRDGWTPVLTEAVRQVDARDRAAAQGMT